MTDTCWYTIEIHGRAGESDLRGICPPGFRVEEMRPDGLSFRVECDQAGLMGLLRALHGRGMVFDAVQRHLNPTLSDNRCL